MKENKLQPNSMMTLTRDQDEPPRLGIFYRYRLKGENGKFIELCHSGLTHYFGFIPFSIRIAKKNPKKKGWRKFVYDAGHVNDMYMAFTPQENKAIESLIPYPLSIVVFYAKGEQLP